MITIMSFLAEYRVERAVKNREEERKEIYGKRRWGGTKNWEIRKNGIRIEHKTKGEE